MPFLLAAAFSLDVRLAAYGGQSATLLDILYAQCQRPPGLCSWCLDSLSSSGVYNCPLSSSVFPAPLQTTPAPLRYSTMQHKPSTTPYTTEIIHKVFGDPAETYRSMSRFAHVGGRRTNVARPKNVRITSAGDLEMALRILKSDTQIAAPLRSAVTEWDLNGRIPGRAAKFWLNQGDRAHPSLLPPPGVLPNLCALRIRSWNSQFVEQDFLSALHRLTTVTELHLHNCTFLSGEHFTAILFSLPSLTELTLDNVSWRDVDGHPGQGSSGQFTSPFWCARYPLPLHTLRIRAPCNSGPLFKWLVERKCVHVRHLELTMFDQDNARHAAWYVQHLGYALETLVCGLVLYAAKESPEGDWLHLQHNPNLRALSIDIYDAQPHYCNWIHKVLTSASRCPLESVAFALSLGYNELLWSEPWEIVHNLFTTYWRSTLREVAVTHYAQWQFVPDAEPLFRARFPELARRGILSVYNIETEESVDTKVGTYQFD
ncbi:hypothetical protein C8Q73DRAFT_791810 [Cubamyces lactineus]|nr:hypothetical protein C8Q73DRAFT_791810 [Cubamyces lactineus]